MTTSWGQSWAIAGGTLGGRFAKCLGDAGQVLDELFGDCLGGPLRKSRSLPGGNCQRPWGILGKACKVLKATWPRVGGILGQLPWGALGEIMQNAGGLVANFLESSWEVLQWSRGALATSRGQSRATSFGKSQGVHANCLGNMNTLLGPWHDMQHKNAHEQTRTHTHTHTKKHR